MQTAEIVQRAIDYIEEHLEEHLSLDQIAEAAAMSVPNLYRMFYAVTGHPVKEYLRRRRTSEAAALLRQSTIPTIEIGFACGFETYQTFVSTFKRNTGLTPGLYRQAELIYSFEKIRLNERVSYMEEREVSERYPDVKVIRLAPLTGIGYLHTSKREEGLEDEALIGFRDLLAKNQIDAASSRLFGWNIDLEEEEEPFGYQLVAVPEKERVFLTENQDLKLVNIPNGLYAVTRTPTRSSSSIVASWNQLVSEWLPKSTFELGEHGYIEEYQQFRRQITRLKLYLPVKRCQGKETMEITERAPVRTISFRAEGADCMARADDESVEWLNRRGLAGDRRLQVYMSCSFPPGERNVYEIFISLPEEAVLSEEDAEYCAWLDGGLYACLTTKAYGSLTGILERIYQWLGSSQEYEPDGERTWYAHYLPPEDLETDLERSVFVVCCVPVIQRREEKNHEAPSIQ